MSGTATLTVKNQLTLPAQIVRAINAVSGMKFSVTLSGETIVLKKNTGWDSLDGVFSKNPLAKKYSVMEAISMAKQIEAERLANEK